MQTKINVDGKQYSVYVEGEFTKDELKRALAKIQNDASSIPTSKLDRPNKVAVKQGGFLKGKSEVVWVKHKYDSTIVIGKTEAEVK